MVTFSESAQRNLRDYLRQARQCLRGSKSVDADEVEQNITEHIESELEGVSEPVSCDDLNAVLQKLGSPQQWVPADELPWWRKIIFRLRNGPEDWRLAYISFGLLVLGCGLPWTLGVFVLASFIVSRAALSEAGDTSVLKGQRWLLYPSLIIVYAFVLLVLLTWPLLPLIPLADEFEHVFRESSSRFDEDRILGISIVAAGLGLWWTVLGLIFLKPRRVLRIFFNPFADELCSKWPLRLLLVGLGLMILSVSACVLYYKYII